LHGYELTERGKIVVTVVVVVLVFLIPATVLMLTAMANQSSSLYVNQDSGASNIPPTSYIEQTPSTRPPPNGGGLNPIDTPMHDGGNGSIEVPLSDGCFVDDPPEFGPTGGNPSEGTLSFMFSPNLQNSLDPSTKNMMYELVNSAKNTEENVIAVELPQLSDEDVEKTMSAISSAFADLGIPSQRLAYITDQSELTENAFEVHLSFIQHRQK